MSNEITAKALRVVASSMASTPEIPWPKVVEAIASNRKNWNTMARAIRLWPEMPWIDAFSSGQIESKLWLLDELSRIQHDMGCIYVMAGWVGVLPWLMFQDDRFVIGKVRSIDVDPSCQPAADRLNIPQIIDGWRFKAATIDVTTMQWDENGCHSLAVTGKDGEQVILPPERPTCIINTSCDHFEDVGRWVKSLPSQPLLVLQSVDKVHDDTHVNCHANIDEFIQQADLSTVYYSGVLRLPLYNRFMIIGKR